MNTPCTAQVAQHRRSFSCFTFSRFTPTFALLGNCSVYVTACKSYVDCTACVVLFIVRVIFVIDDDLFVIDIASSELIEHGRVSGPATGRVESSCVGSCGSPCMMQNVTLSLHSVNCSLSSSGVYCALIGNQNLITSKL